MVLQLFNSKLERMVKILEEIRKEFKDEYGKYPYLLVRKYEEGKYIVGNYSVIKNGLIISGYFVAKIRRWKLRRLRIIEEKIRDLVNKNERS